MRKQNYMVINGQNLVVESITVGKPSKDVLNTVAMVIAQSYLNREVHNG